MASIENLVNKILEDAKNEAARINSEAKSEQSKIIDKKVKEAEEIKRDMLAKAEREAVTRKARVISNAQLKVRNEKLESKQKVVNNVFEEALIAINKLDNEKFNKYAENIILNAPIAGDEKIILSSNFKSVVDDKFLTSINEKLKEKGKNGNLRISNEERNLNGGFIIAKNGIELNYTFDALINSLKDEIEGEVIKSLFA